MRGELAGDDPVDEALHEAHQRSEAFIHCARMRRLGGGAIDLAHERFGRDEEDEADDAREEFVVGVFQQLV